MKNVIERAVILTRGDVINTADLPEAIINPTDNFTVGEALNYQERVNKAKQAIVEAALLKAGGNIHEAAKALNIHSNNLYRLLKSLGIEK